MGRADLETGQQERPKGSVTVKLKRCESRKFLRLKTMIDRERDRRALGMEESEVGDRHGWGWSWDFILRTMGNHLSFTDCIPISRGFHHFFE